MDTNYLIDKLDEGVYIIDPETHEMLYINPAGIETMNLKGIDYKGLKCYQILHGDNFPCGFCNNDILNYDSFQVWEYTNSHINRHFILKDKLIMYNNKPARMEVAIDITETENVSESLRKRLEIEKVIVKCIKSLTSEKSLKGAVEKVLEAIGKFYDADRAYIIEADTELELLENTYEWCREGVMPSLEFAGNLDIEDLGIWMEAFYNNDPIMIEDVEEIKDSSPGGYKFLKLQDIRSLYAVPFSVQDMLAGYIGVDNPRENLGDRSLMDSIEYFVINEITKRRMNEKLEYRSYHDALTGLPNRNSYVEYIDNLNQENIKSVGIAVLDINGLKVINQNYGHTYGDITIKSMVKILKDYFDENTIFRLSGDEFVIICENINRKDFILEVRRAKLGLENMEHNGVSIGYTWSEMDINIPVLVKHADELMYIEKQTYYKGSSATVKNHNPKELQSLLESLENNEYEMYLQPKANISTGEISGAEALVRYIEPSGKVVSPERFISILEKYRTIKYIDFFMYEQVLKALSEWREKGYKLIPISCNFSRITMLSEDLINDLISINNKYNIPRELVEIEITESVGEVERETIAEISLNIRKHGFAIALDDFGQKYTSMSMLTFMKFDVLKLDRSLVNNIVNSKDNHIVVRHVIEMCREMGVKCVAEGVENVHQLSILKQFKCDAAQGYLFSKPIPKGEFENKYLTKQRKVNTYKINK